MSTQTATIAALFIYPVKSLKGIAVDSIPVTPHGLQDDRQWMIVDHDGRLVSQRQLPQMALLSASITVKGLQLTDSHGASIEVCNNQLDSRSVAVFLFRDSCSGFAATSEVNQWITDTLNSQKPLRLVKFDQRQQRNSVNTSRFAGHTTYFADASPYLITNTGSLDALNHHLQQRQLAPINIKHFRPNIVITGIDPFNEHHYSSMKNDLMEFNLIDHSSRCSIITINPATGQFLPKAYPFKALTELNAMPQEPTKPAFGVNSVLKNGSGAILQVGDTVFLQ